MLCRYKPKHYSSIEYLSQLIIQDMKNAVNVMFPSAPESITEVGRWQLQHKVRRRTRRKKNNTTNDNNDNKNNNNNNSNNINNNQQPITITANTNPCVCDRFSATTSQLASCHGSRSWTKSTTMSMEAFQCWLLRVTPGSFFVCSQLCLRFVLTWCVCV